MSSRVRQLRRRATPLLAFIPVVLMVGVAVGITRDESPGTCNRNIAEAASSQFTVESGKAVRDRIPHLGIAPELEAITEPVSVVMFEGPHHAVPVYPALLPSGESMPAIDGVLCFVTPSGEEIYYSGVDFTGTDLSGLAIDRIAR